MNRTQGVRGSNPLRSTDAHLRISPNALSDRGLSSLPPMSFFSPDDPERQANIAFALVVLGIVAVGALTIWLFYGAQF